MSDPGARSALAFMACPPERFVELAERLRQEHPDVDWDLVCFYDPDVRLPEGTRLIRSSGTLGFATSLWVRALRTAYRAVYVVTVETARTQALLPLIEFVSVLPCRHKVLLDPRGMREALTPRAGAGLLVSLALTPVLLTLARLVTRVGLRIWPGGTVRPRQGGRTAIVVPIMPDLSHTFVYREVLAVKQRHPEYEVLVLEPGDPSVVHHEAAALAKVSTVVPRLSRNRYLMAYLAAWLRRPAAMASLVHFFRPHTGSFGPGATGDDALCFLRLEYLYHSNYLTLGFMLADWLRRRRIAYVHVYGSTYPAVRALVANRCLGIRFSLSTFVDFDYVTPFHMLAEKLEAARFVVVCTAYCSRQLASRFPGMAPKLRVLRHALRRDYTEGKALRPRDGRSRLVYIGRFVPKKGLDTLIETCALLRDRGVTVSCHLYGRGDLEDALAELIAHRRLSDVVRLEPPIPNEEMYSVMNEDDIFVSPSRYMADGERDGIPVTLLEAMAAGITVVSTPVSGIPELIEDGVNGYLVAPDDPPALACLLEGLIRDPRRRQTVSAAARATIRERFSLEESGATLAEWISRESRS